MHAKTQAFSPIGAALLAIGLCATLCLKLAAAESSTPAGTPFQPSLVEPDGSVSVPAFRMPFSSYASAEAKAELIEWRAIEDSIDFAKLDILNLRRVYDEKLYLPLAAKQAARFAVTRRAETIGGVYTEVFGPREGESPRNANRILINLHGGGFIVGARTVGRIEATPIAGTAKIRVISVDYRMAPESKFPAASEDVAAVYKELLKHYKPENIGIYGCSAGGLLTAQALVWFQREQLPTPGAVGIFCASTHGFMLGDSGQLAARLGDGEVRPPSQSEPELTGPYFDGVSASDALAAPHLSPAALARFPPTLFITGSRSFDMSGASRSQIELTLLGVEARLSVWDGMLHNFFYDPDPPESREVYQVVARFFSEYLGRPRSEK